MREALQEREIRWRGPPHRPSPAFRAAASFTGCARRGCSAWGCSSMTISAAAICCRRPARSTSRRTRSGKPLITGPRRKGLRIFRLLGRGRPAGGAERARRGRRGAEIRTRSRAVEKGRAIIWPVTVEDTSSSGPKHNPTPRRWSMPAGPWVADVWTSRRLNQGQKCAWCRARTSWCAGCTSMTAPTCSRTPTAASSSPFPIEEDFTLIGTTDQDYRRHAGRREGDGRRDRLSLQVLANIISKHITPADVVWTYSGVRPLYDDGASGPRRRPAITSSSSTRPAARRCCRSMAARSPPIVALPKRRWSGLRPI